jgi:hypothetical protein
MYASSGMWLLSLRQIDHWTLPSANLVHAAGSNAFVIGQAAEAAAHRKPLHNKRRRNSPGLIG